jgi:cystathionine gamma-synthase
VSAAFEDNFFPSDAVVMEANSREFESRVTQMCQNAERLASFLKEHPLIKNVYYPKLNDSSRANYEECRKPLGGYGYLLTVLFHERQTAINFLDSLNVAKGPSLGTEFTLASPYTLLTHIKELDWVSLSSAI